MFPNYIRVTSVDWSSEQNAVSSESRNLITLTRTLPGHRWAGRFNVQVLPYDVRSARAWLYGLQVDDANVTYSDEDWATNVTGVAVAAAASAGASTVSVSSTNDIEPGMMLNFGGHSKLYMVLSANAGNVQIFPELHADVIIGEALILDAPTATLELPPELKRSATLASQLERDPSSINLRMWEVRR